MVEAAGGASDRDRTLRLPAIRLRPRALNDTIRISSALRNDPIRFFIRLCNFYPVDGALAVKIEERLPMQSALPVPIEGRRASAALRDGLRAARRVLECRHTRLTPSAAVLRQDRARRPGWLGRRMALLWW